MTTHPRFVITFSPGPGVDSIRSLRLLLKAEGGRATDAQLACIAALREAGAFTCIAEGLDRALACLEAWGLLRTSSRRTSR